VRSQTDNQTSVEELVGGSPCMRRLRRQARQLARCDVNLLLQGESGTGKELLARMVHRLSRRRSRPFIGVNCAAIHETLLESELFGHEAGAFTGASHATAGFLRAAEGGTILLDEVGDMSGPLQSKLLRVLEERAVVPVGATRAVPIDVRVIAATHQDLAEAVRKGTFRQDLYYRLNVVSLEIPPLRRRPEDIRPLIEHMLRRVAAVLNVPVKRVAPESLEALERYSWPGNVRELGNFIQRAYVLGRGRVIGIEDLPEQIVRGQGEAPAAFLSLREVIRCHVRSALARTDGVRGQAARLLGVDRKTLGRMIRRYGLA